MSTPAIIVRDIGKQFLVRPTISRKDTLAGTAADNLRHLSQRFFGLFNRQSAVTFKAAREFWALRDVSFEVQKGEVLGIIGWNGSGKSTLLKILARITPPTEGEADIAGRVGSLLEIGTGFHSELTGRENTFLSGTILGMKEHEISARFDEIVDFSGVGDFIDTPVKHYSSGMYLRLAFAVAAHLRTEILMIDEVLAVGDAAFQKKCIDKMSEVSSEGRTVLFVSHNLGIVSRLCNRGLLLDNGKVAANGPVTEVVATYGRMVEAREEEISLNRAEGIIISNLKVQPDGLCLETSTPLSFSFRMVIQKTYWNLFVQLGITTPEGLTLVLDSINSEHRPELRNPGRYKIEITLPALWLRPMIYSSRIKVIAHPEAGSTERFYSEWVDIAVKGGVHVESAAARVLTPLSQWHIQAEAD